MELVDKNPNSDETMSQIAEELLDKFGSESEDGWVVLVGDGKTYQHLMNIKRQYGKSQQKLLILPGNWHTLKNYQPVLMKMYYTAGLREMAKSSGYRGQTRNSPECCKTSREPIAFFCKYGRLSIERCYMPILSTATTKV